MLMVCVIGRALIPAYTMLRSTSLVTSVFFEQFCVGGVWGPMSIHLLELSPIALRTVLVGLTYQLGSLASSASATIQSIIGERFPLPPGAHGKKRFDYGKVMAIFMGAVWAFMLFFLFWGPEMSQEERDEEAEASMRLEQLRAEGVSLADSSCSWVSGLMRLWRNGVLGLGTGSRPRRHTLNKCEGTDCSLRGTYLMMK